MKSTRESERNWEVWAGYIMKELSVVLLMTGSS